MRRFSSTQVLSGYIDFSKIPEDVLNYASDRGSRVHFVCERYAKGIPVLKLTGDVRPYFESFCLWFDRYVDKVYFVEERFSCPFYGFDGKPDLGVRLIDGRKVIPDLKTPVVESPTWKGQLASYLYLVNRSGKYGTDFKESIALQLSPRGKEPRARVYKYYEDDFAAFLSALNAKRYFSK
jgi:hypothetical protein